METLDRNLLYIVPTKKCIDWVNSIDPEDPIDYNTYVTEHDNASVYLIPEHATADSAMAWMKKSWNVWFETLLMDWYMDENLWPENRSWELLNEFFDIRWQSFIEDCLPLPIKKEESEF
jgi:hypothetical protein